MPTNQIGTLAEKSLHAALKSRYAQPGDLLECSLGGYVVDIVRPTPEATRCIEIQTRNLPKMKRKLLALLDAYPVHVVVPIAQERTIVRLAPTGTILSRRKSPKRGSVFHLFSELVSLPTFIHHPHFTLEVLLISEEQRWVDDGLGSWRRRHWSIQDRRLLAVRQAISFTTAADFAALLPSALPDGFDSQELAAQIQEPRAIAQKMAYCLRAMGVLQVIGKRANTLLYQRPAG